MSSSIIASASLYLAFRDITLGSNLCHYLSLPNNGYSNKVLSEKLYGYLSMRVPFDTINEPLGYAPQDSGILKKRFKVMCNDNEAYILAMKENLSLGEIEAWSKREPCYATLKPVKDYLSHHPELIALYRGMLPFGKNVIATVNAIEGYAPRVLSTPSFSDHVRLMELTNGIADRTGFTSLYVNDQFYLYGKKLVAHQAEADEPNKADVESFLKKKQD